MGFTGVYIIFLISAQIHRLWYSLEPPHRGGSNEYPQSMFRAEIWKISEFFIWKFSVFEVKFSIYLNRRVFVMGWGAGGGVTSYIWHSTDVRAEWPPFSALLGIWLAPFFQQKVYILRSNFSSFPQYFQYISNFKSPVTYIVVKYVCLNYFFLDSANLICRGTDISKYFIESLGFRDNESRLYPIAYG